SRTKTTTVVRAAKHLYVLAEKILAMDESLPRDWAVHGTTGYDFLAQVNAFFVDPAGEADMTRVYQDFTGDDTPFEELAYENKRLILRIALASELHMLAHRFDRLAQRDRRWRDVTLNALIEALAEVIACFGVYRTYISSGDVTDVDRRYIESAVEKAKARAPRTEPAIFNFIQDALLQRYPDHFDAEARAEQVRIAGKFQQLTSPTAAKGIEDTTFYQYHRLISLNEVGGDPARFGVSPDDLHRFFAERQKHWPHAMSTLSTHDTKRSEDVRARLNVLSEIPDEWRARVTRWREINAGEDPPHPGEAYLLYQTLVGAFPIEAIADDVPASFIERVTAFMMKAMRESKLRSTWGQPDEAYEQRVTSFVERILQSKTFLNDFVPFQKRISRWGMLNSLSQTLLKLTAPGVPDTYQGTELWDLSLVDPDNRRPVDYGMRQEMMKEIESHDASSLAASLDDGRAKMLVTMKSLQARRTHPGLFCDGDYVALLAKGQAARHVFAFGRCNEDVCAAVVVPRLVASRASRTFSTTTIDLPHDWRLRRWKNAFTGSEMSLNAPALNVGKLFAEFPVTVLIARRSPLPPGEG
nr:malto-oligosyltrehalose synthase [Chthoniobacterales bacterium]